MVAESLKLSRFGNLLCSVLRYKLFELKGPKTNWWIWLGISFTAGAWLFFVPYENGEGFCSDWNIYSDWTRWAARNFRFDSYFFSESWDCLGEPFFHSILPAIISGGIGQLLVVLLWNRYNQLISENRPGNTTE